MHAYRPTRQAIRDLTRARDYFDDQQPELGADFLEDFDSTMRQVRESPRSYFRVTQRTHRVQLSRFPYHIYYYISAFDVVVVMSVCHGARDPAKWRKHM